MTLDIANRLVELRKKHSLSQEQLAERLGISRQAVSKWERAEAAPDTDNLILLSRLYGVSLDGLLNTDGPDEEFVKRAEAPNDGCEGDPSLVGYRKYLNKNGMVVIGGAEYTLKEALRRYWWIRAAAAAVAVAGVAAMIILYGTWNWGWIFIPAMLIPLTESLMLAVISRNPHEFAFPILAVMVYLALGFFGGLWSCGWLIFLAVPLYYWLVPDRSSSKK